MTRPVYPLPDLDPLTTREVANAFGMSERYVLDHVERGRFPGAFRTVSEGPNPGRWRIPHDAAVKVGRWMGVFE